MQRKLDNIEHDEGGGDDGAAPPTAKVIVARCFRVLSVASLTVSLPRSLLLLPRPSLGPPQFLGFPTFLSSVPGLIPYLLLTIVCLSTLSHLSTGYAPKPRLPLAWTAVAVLQATLGIQTVVAVPIGVLQSDAPTATRTDAICRIVAFVGAYEMTIFWWRFFVLPVVDHATYGVADAAHTDDTSMEKVAVNVAFGVLWVTLLHGNLEIPIGVRHLGCSWMVGTMMMFIGLMGIVRAIFWVAMPLSCLPSLPESEDEELQDLI